MASKLILGIALAVFVCSIVVQGQNTCLVAASLTRRLDYVESGRNKSVFDITVNNIGTCTVQTININLTVSGVIEQSFNLAGSPINEIVFGGYLAAGQIFTGAGFIASNNGSVSASITVTSVSCRSCNITSTTGSTTGSNSTATGSGSTTGLNATTGSGSTTGSNATTGSGSTTGSATTGSGSTTGSNATTGSVSTTGSVFTGCPAAVTTTLRQSYTIGSTTNYLYDISVTNLAPFALNTVGITYGIENRTVTQTFNLVQTCCTQISSAVSYNVSVYNLQPGGTFNGAGFVQSLPVGTNTTTPVAQVFNPATGLICGL